MCFEEFIGYTCGHRSLSVLRPCPLTTASHTFPACSLRGDKAFLAGEMCSACQKIIHSRATQIEEFEHRFMHERGACGCETVFPYLIRPRVIGGGPEEEEAANDACGTTGGEAKVTAATRIKRNETRGPSSTGNQSLPPILKEKTDAHGKSVVSVRLSSLFAAEWVEDHRARHEAGLCQCKIDFRTYQEAKKDKEANPAVVTNDVTSKDSHQTEDDEDLGRYLRRPQANGQYRSLSASPPQGRAAIDTPDDSSDESESNNGHDRRSARSTDGRLQSSTLSAHAAVFSPGAKHSNRIGSITMQFSEDEDSTNDEGSAGAKARKTDATPSSSSSSSSSSKHATETAAHVLYPDTKIVRFSGAIFTKVPDYLPLTGPFLDQPAQGSRGVVVDGVLLARTAVGPKTKATGEDDKEDAEGKKASDTSNGGNGTTSSPAETTQDMPPLVMPPEMVWDGSVPLAGLPLGAGPEGVPHTVLFHTCLKCWQEHNASDAKAKQDDKEDE